MPIQPEEKVVHKVCRDLPHPYFSSPKKPQSLDIQTVNTDFI